MNRYEIEYHKNGKWWVYTIFRNRCPIQDGYLRTKSAAVKHAEKEVQKLQRAEQHLAD